MNYSAPFYRLSLFLVSVLLCTSVSANLLIYPTRVDFQGNDRVKEITLTNTSQQTNTYRLEWDEKRALPAGGYVDLTEEEAKHFPVSSTMLRFTPRQVTLAPGERQTVKLAIRRPKGLADGEYRSHLKFSALPPAQNQAAQDSAIMQINMVMSFAVPIVIQQGNTDIHIKLSDAKISYQPAKNTGTVTLKIDRQGMHSIIGNMTAYWTPQGGHERVIARLGEYNLWADNGQTTVNMFWVGNEFPITDGELKIVYKGAKSFSGKTFMEEKISIRKSNIEILSAASEK